ncbi:amidohydrolase [Mangrovimicrobium sediminis]|uniref:Amidohydrolase n=1 Tax=Mangrovimicrobium sediminis TaxID=2562682 RepID=A0A4Z0LX22_9GAMM|nr:N(2)-acetyl-L-2,4-diaminobutanoate deacetylase DoeB2 [Haliea sp. SAOS-164]TGD71831.1 amidohydrolase [Haliea sp. SAOS-164]
MQATWSTLLDEALTFRHQLHRQPELTWQEAHTARLIREALTRLDIPWRPCAKYGTVATLAADAKGEHIALRGDIDALPILEATDLSYRSEHAGCMHACGHDGHTAALWATGAWLKSCEAQLPGPVSLLFQPAEEGGHGAREMIADGALEGIDCIYGWHNWPAIPFGKAVCPDGAVMSGNGTFEITVRGRGGHASQPELCSNPVTAAAAIVVNLQQIISHRVAPQDAGVVAITSIDAPSGPTIIPDTARLAGGIRLARPGMRAEFDRLIRQISKDTARTYGVEAEVDIQPRYEATINHPGPAQRFREGLAAEFGDDWRMAELALPIMASEDFSYYLDAIPGAFALIGMAQDGCFDIPCHSPRYQFNDALIAPVVRTFSRLVGVSPPG